MKRSRLFSLVTSLVLFVCLLLFVASLFFLITPSWWQPRIVRWLQAPETKLHSDAIIVLGGDTVRRAKTGVELFQEGLSTRLVITGDNPQEQNPYKREAQQALELATAQGVPQNAITLLPTTSTFEDAQQITRFMRESGLSRVIVVSDWFHARRAMCSVKQALGDQDAQVLFWPAQMAFGPQNWGQSEDGVTAVFTEFIKSNYYIIEHSVPMWNCWPGDVNVLILPGLWIASGVLGLGIILGIRRWASDHLLDIPGERSSHKIPTPRGGGVGIVVMTLLPVGLWLLLSKDFSPEIGLVYIVTSGLIAVIGWVDDQHSLSARGRLALHFLLAGVLLVISGAVIRLEIPLLGIATLGTGIGFFISLVWIAGLTNAYNFMDGIDGLAGIQAVIAGMAWSLVLLFEGQMTLALLAGSLAAASLGFLLVNAPPALIFMGDVGSTFLGFTLAS